MKNQKIMGLVFILILAIGVSGLAFNLTQSGEGFGDLLKSKNKVTCYIRVANYIGDTLRIEGTPNCEISGKCKSLYTVGEPLSLFAEKGRLTFDVDNLIGGKAKTSIVLGEGARRTFQISTCTNERNGQLILEQIDEKIGLDGYSEVGSKLVNW